MPETESSPKSEREFDLVLFGASSFVGELTAAYLAENVPDGFRVALAGRSPEKLEKTRSALPGGASEWPILLADSHDDESLAAMAKSTRVLVTTVGPYAKYGLPVVHACAEAGTDYADLTGEPLFMRRSIDQADPPAKASGARIVHTCGFDSIPSDLGVLALHQAAKEAGAGDLGETTLVVEAMKGGFSGGTIASMKGQIDESKADPEARRLAADPYALSPDRASDPDGKEERDSFGISRDPDTGDYPGPVRDGGREHPRRQAKQCAPGQGIRNRHALPRVDESGLGPGRGGQGGDGCRWAGRTCFRTCVSPDPDASRPDPPRSGGRPQ